MGRWSSSPGRPAASARRRRSPSLDGALASSSARAGSKSSTPSPKNAARPGHLTSTSGCSTSASAPRLAPSSPRRCAITSGWMSSSTTPASAGWAGPTRCPRKRLTSLSRRTSRASSTQPIRRCPGCSSAGAAWSSTSPRLSASGPRPTPRSTRRPSMPWSVSPTRCAVSSQARGSRFAWYIPA